MKSLGPWRLSALALLLAAAPAAAGRVETGVEVGRPDLGSAATPAAQPALAAPSLAVGGPAAAALSVAAVPPSAAPLAAPAAAAAVLAPALPAPAALPAAAAAPGARAPPSAAAGDADAALAYAPDSVRSAEARDRGLDALFDARWSLKRTPVGRGEIGWKRAWRYLDPSSKDNTVRAPFKFAAERAQESAMWRHNVAYVLGLTPRTWAAEQDRRRRLARLAKLAERGARIRAAYKLAPYGSLRLPTVVPGQKLGEGGEGTAYAVEGDPGRVVKTFDRASGSQVQELAAFMNALAARGLPVARVRLVRLPDGRAALEMPRYDRSTGWSNLADYWRRRRRDPKAPAGEAVAMVALRAVGAETERVLGVNAADWKKGFDGGDGDEFMENFAIHDKTGEVVAFDPIAVW